MKKVTVALVGAGGISLSQHLPNLSRAPHVNFKWVCDLDQGKLDYALKHYNIPKTTTEVDKVLEDADVGMVVVATREDMQAALTVRALQAGKHVYVEKPLAATPEECAKVVEAQEKAGRNVAVGFNRRRSPAYQKAKEIIDACGGATNIYYRIADNYWLWSQRFQYEPRTRVIHEVCHIFDIIRFFTGSDAASVYCAESRPDDEIITLKMQNGAVATILNSGYTQTDLPKEHVEVILGDKGAVMVDDFVELKQYGSLDFDPKYTFPGHTHALCEYTHKFLYEELGLPAHEAMRHLLWKKRLQMENGEFGEETLGLEEMKYFLQGSEGHEGRVATNPNYAVNKGWLDAVDHFAQSCLDGTTPHTATAQDALAASCMAEASMESRDSGKPVFFDWGKRNPAV